MKLLLVNIYPSDTIARYLLSSYALKAYLLAHLRGEDEFLIKVLNFSPTLDVLKIREKIMDEKPDCIGYSCYIWNIEKILKLIKALNEKARFINILGGPEISMNRIRLLPEAKVVDFYVIGEGERILLNLMRYIIGKEKAEGLKIPNGVAVCNNGRFEYLPDADRIIDLDEIPSGGYGRELVSRTAGPS